MSAAELCKTSKGINKIACMRFFQASTGKEGQQLFMDTYERHEARKKKQHEARKNKKKSKAQKALGINKK